MGLDTFGDIFQRVPHALAPFVVSAEIGARFFWLFHASGSIFVGYVWVTTTFTLTTFFVNAVHVGQTFGKFAQSVSAPVGQIGAVGAIAYGSGQQIPFAADFRVLGDRTNVAEFVAHLFLRVQREAAFFFVALAAANFERAMSAFVGHFETFGQGEHGSFSGTGHIDGRLTRSGQIFAHCGQGDP